MKIFHFLSKVTFLCNLFFVACLILKYKNFIGQHVIEEIVVINGWLLAFILNAIVSILALFCILKTRKNIEHFRWIAIANGAFFLFQLYYFFI